MRSTLTRTVVVALLFGLSALLTSRVVLLGHEFFGHGGAAWLVGGEVVDHRLFLFGGGWVITRTPSLSGGEALFVSLGGVLLELGFASLFIWFSRGQRSVAARACATIAAGLCIVHIGVYISLGTHYGYGDGLLLHRTLGGARWGVVIAMGGLAIGGAAWLGRALPSLLAPTFKGLSRARLLAALVAATGLAGVFHGGLMLAERAVRDDPTYVEIMRAEAERNARRTVALEARRRRALGQEMSAGQQRTMTRRLADAARPLPIRVPLYVLIGLAAIVCAWRFRERGSTLVVQPRDVGVVAIAAMVAVLLVLLLHAPWWR